MMRASAKIVRLALAALACAVTLPLVTSAAMAAEVKRNGAFLQKQCGHSEQGAGPGCAWCTGSGGCYVVTDCQGSKCTIVQTKHPAIARVSHGPVDNGGIQRAAVKSQQPPPVWSGSTRPIEGNKTNKPGPIH